jgi:hypothetical protein
MTKSKGTSQSQHTHRSSRASHQPKTGSERDRHPRQDDSSTSPVGISEHGLGTHTVENPTYPGVPRTSQASLQDRPHAGQALTTHHDQTEMRWFFLSPQTSTLLLLFCIRVYRRASDLRRPAPPHQGARNTFKVLKSLMPCTATLMPLSNQHAVLRSYFRRTDSTARDV